MRSIVLIVVCLALLHHNYAQPLSKIHWTDFGKSSQTGESKLPAGQVSEQAIADSLQKFIAAADERTPLQELTNVITACISCCVQSETVALLLTKWLKESHPIYSNRTATDANQFRGFLLASLGKFPPTEELYMYVKAELIFGGHPYNIAAAAFTARQFPGKADELISLMEPYLSREFNDKVVDISTPELRYPVSNPTRARYEIIRTLVAYRSAAFRSVKLLDEIAAASNSFGYAADSILFQQAQKAAAYLRETTPECCRKEPAQPVSKALAKIDRANRKKILNDNFKVVDQEGKPVQFGDFRNKPFVLTFFYTQCANPFKCVSTVHRLAKVAQLCVKNQLGERVGLYGITYDPDFDSPSKLKRYGETYGIEFGKTVRFLKAADNAKGELSSKLNLRVSYGGGSVNQHGLQLFVFDRKGRLAATSDNELWEAKEVYEVLNELVAED